MYAIRSYYADFFSIGSTNRPLFGFFRRTSARPGRAAFRHRRQFAVEFTADGGERFAARRGHGYAVARRLAFAGGVGLRRRRALARITSYNVCYTKLLRIEDLQILHLFANSDVFHRNFKLIANTNYNTTFCCSVELRQGQSSYLGS